MSSHSLRPTPVHPALRAQINDTSRKLVLGVGALVLAITFYYAIASWVTYGFEYGLLSLAGAAAFSMVFGLVLLRKEFDPAEPVSLILLSLAIGVAFKPAYVLFGPREEWSYLLLNEPDPLFLLTPAVLIVIAMGCLSLGYLSGGGRSLIANAQIFNARPWSGWRVGVLTVLGVVISIAGMALFIQKMGIGNVLDNISGKRFYAVEDGTVRSPLGYLRWAASASQPAFVLLLAWVLQRYRRIPILLALSLVLVGLMTMLFPFFVSSRTGIITVVLQAFIVWRCIRGSIPRSVLVSTSAFIMVLVFLVATLRPQKAGVEGVDISESVGLDGMIEMTVGGRHFFDLTRTAHIVQNVPELIPFQYGATYVSWMVAPIPRTMWPQKPSLGSGPMIGREVFRTAAGVPPGLVAELYLNFGAVGVLFGSFLMGLLIRVLFEQFRPVLSTPVGAVLYACLVVPLGWEAINGDFSRMVVNALLDIIPVLVGLWFIRGAVSRRVRRRAPVVGAFYPAR